MKAGFGKQKGGTFEREICKKLSLWISNSTRDDIFWRSAMSGGRASVQFKKGQQNLTQAGDISAIDPLGDFFIKKCIVECKFYKNLQLENLFFTVSNSGIVGFWNILLQKIADSKKIPFLVVKQNYKEPLLGTSYRMKSLLKKHNYPDFSIGIFPERDLIIYDFATFLEKIDPILFTKEEIFTEI